MNDLDLVLRAQSGDLEAVSGLYQRYFREAYQVAYLLLGNHGLAEDVVQETFIQVIRKIHSLRDPSRFRPWLFQIVTNAARHAHRKTNWRRLRSLDLETHDKPDRAAVPTAEYVEIDEEIRELQQAIKRLKPAQQIPLVLYYFNQLSENEIADILRCPVGTVKSRLYYARQELHRMLSKASVLYGSSRRPNDLLIDKKG